MSHGHAHIIFHVSFLYLALVSIVILVSLVFLTADIQLGRCRVNTLDNRDKTGEGKGGAHVTLLLVLLPVSWIYVTVFCKSFVFFQIRE